MGDDAKIDAVQSYLQKQFDGFEVMRRTDRGQGPELIVRGNGREYLLILDQNLLRERSEGELTSALAAWDVRGELCRAEGVPLIVTEHGVRLASSN